MSKALEESQAIKRPWSLSLSGQTVNPLWATSKFKHRLAPGRMASSPFLSTVIISNSNLHIPEQRCTNTSDEADTQTTSL